VYQFFAEFQIAYSSVTRAVLHNIITEFETPMKLVGSIKMYLNEICSEVQIGEYLMYFPVRMRPRCIGTARARTKFLI